MQQRITASSCATTPDREKTASSRAFQALLVYWIKLILLVLLAMLGIWALWQLAWGNNDATALKPLQHESPFPGHSINNGVGKMTTSMFNICHQRPLSLTILMTAFSGAILMSVSERFGDWIDRIKKRTHRLSRQMLLDAVDLPTLVVERDFRVVMANVAARSLMDDNQTPRLCYEIHHRDKPCVPKLEDCPVQRAFETGLTIRTRHRHFNRRGEAVYLNVTATPVRNKRGDVVQVIETFHDVSAEQYSFEERRQRENFLQTLINTVPAPIYYKNMKGIYLGCNPSFSERILGCTPEAVVGKSLFDFPIRIPTELAELYRRKDCELFERGGVQYYEAP
ncbi:MAG: PAS domain-containing protein, partial [Sedimentisphaerales bacterium]|nr:PAS domain-containing protein [Sedimentisphaerales bacterium]